MPTHNPNNAADHSSAEPDVPPTTSGGGPSVAELGARINALEQELAARQDMLAMVSHDLRGPASVIKLGLEYVHRSLQGSDGDGADPQITRAVQQADVNVDRMIDLVNDLLTLSRTETDVFEIHRERVDLCEVVDDVVDDFGDAVEASGSELTITAPATAMGSWDRTRLVQLVSNLVSNAINYGQGSPIGIDLQTTGDGDAAKLCVSDRGQGIPVDRHSEIFERFTRLDTDIDHRTDDTYGLGLWVVASVVDALGGTVDVDSEPGQGTTVCVRLPRGPSTP